MKHLLSALFLCLAFSVQAQFRMVSNNTPSWTSQNDSTYTASISFSADQTGFGYLANQIDSTFRLFTGTEQLYRVDSVWNASFSSADLRVVEISPTNGSPAGQVMVFDPDGRETLPAVPFGSTGSTAQLQAAVVSWNARQATGSTGALPTENIWYVAPGGNDATAVKNDPYKPFRSPWTARNNAQAGDIIYIYEGVYTTGDIGSGALLESDGTDLQATAINKDSVIIYLDEGAVLRNTSASLMPLIYDTLGQKIQIIGPGELQNKTSSARIAVVNNDNSELLVNVGRITNGEDNSTWGYGFYLQQFNRFSIEADLAEVTFSRFMELPSDTLQGVSGIFNIDQLEVFDEDATWSFWRSANLINSNIEINVGQYNSVAAYVNQFVGSMVESTLSLNIGSGYFRPSSRTTTPGWFGGNNNTSQVINSRIAINCNSCYFDNVIPFSLGRANAGTNANSEFVVTGNWHYKGDSRLLGQTAERTSGFKTVLSGRFTAANSVVVDKSAAHNIELSGYFESLADTSVVSIRNATGNVKLRHAEFAQGGTTYPSVSATVAATVEVAGAFQTESDSPLDGDVTFVRLSELGGQNGLITELPKGATTIDANGNAWTIDTAGVIRFQDLDGSIVDYQFVMSPNTSIPTLIARYENGDTMRIEMQGGEMRLRDTSGDYSLKQLAEIGLFNTEGVTLSNGDTIPSVVYVQAAQAAAESFAASLAFASGSYTTIDTTVNSDYTVAFFNEARVTSFCDGGIDNTISLPTPVDSLKGNVIEVTHLDTSAAQSRTTIVETDGKSYHFYDNYKGDTLTFLNIYQSGQTVRFTLSEIEGVLRWVAVDLTQLTKSETGPTELGKITQDSDGNLSAYDAEAGGARKVQYQYTVDSVSEILNLKIRLGDRIKVKGTGLEYVIKESNDNLPLDDFYSFAYGDNFAVISYKNGKISSKEIGLSADFEEISGISIDSASNEVACTGCFSTDDIGKKIIIYQAGRFGTDGLGGDELVSSITSFISADSVVIDSTAFKTVTNNDGAKGTDNSPILEGAIKSDISIAFEPSDKKYFFQSSVSITNDSNIVFEGNTADITFISFNNDSWSSGSQSGNAFDLFSLIDTKNITFKDFSVSFAGQSQSRQDTLNENGYYSDIGGYGYDRRYNKQGNSGAFVRTSQSENIILSNITSDGIGRLFAANSGASPELNKNGGVYNCNVKSYGTVAVNPPNNFEIIGNVFANGSAAPISAVNQSNNLGTSHAIYSTSGFKDVKIIGNTFDTIRGTCIQFNTGIDVVSTGNIVSSNSFNETQRAGTILGNSANWQVTMSSNRYYNTGQWQFTAPNNDIFISNESWIGAPTEQPDFPTAYSIINGRTIHIDNCVFDSLCTIGGTASVISLGIHSPFIDKATKIKISNCNFIDNTRDIAITLDSFLFSGSLDIQNNIITGRMDFPVINTGNITDQNLYEKIRITNNDIFGKLTIGFDMSVTDNNFYRINNTDESIFIDLDQFTDTVIISSNNFVRFGNGTDGVVFDTNIFNADKVVFNYNKGISSNFTLDDSYDLISQRGLTENNSGNYQILGNGDYSVSIKGNPGQYAVYQLEYPDGTKWKIGGQDTYKNKALLFSYGSGISPLATETMVLNTNQSISFSAYGAGNKTSTNLIKTGSGYLSEYATDGTLLESNITVSDIDTLQSQSTTLRDTTPATTNFTIRIGEENHINTAGGSVTATVPAGASEGEVFSVYAGENAGTNPATIDFAANGYTVAGQNSRVLNTDYQYEAYRYVGGNKWIIISKAP